MSTKTDELMRLHGAAVLAWGNATGSVSSAVMADAALRSAIQEVVRDAERYQVMRELVRADGDDPAELDAHFDAAMQPEPPEAP